ncbi:MAG: EFR1 family ferrodoxin [Holophagaceae bacterium]|nr:EFR1 family ferrodoxin [Holophagaceae bacterium]
MSPLLTAKICWMSGTGNSLRLAHGFAACVEEKGGEIHLEQIAPNSSPTCEASWLAVFFPTHGFTTPWPVLRWAWSLQPGKGISAAVVSARAGWWMGTCLRGLTGSAPFIPALLLALKGYRVRGILSVDMPSNWILVHPGLNAVHAAHFLERGHQKIRAFTQDLLAGSRRLWSLDNLFECLSGMVLLPVSVGYLLYGRPLFAKLFFANERCNGCGVCAAHCPEGAIRMTGSTPRPYWTLHCESCMRCMNLCPLRAVEAGQSLGVLLNLAAGLPLIGWLLARIAPRWPWLAWLDTGFPRFALNYGWYLAALILVYFLVFQAMRWRPLRLLFSFTTLTRWFRRYREPSTGPRDLPGRWD